MGVRPLDRGYRGYRGFGPMQSADSRILKGCGRGATGPTLFPLTTMRHVTYYSWTFAVQSWTNRVQR
jgi:hypothetical protein